MRRTLAVRSAKTTPSTAEQVDAFAEDLGVGQYSPLGVGEAGDDVGAPVGAVGAVDGLHDGLARPVGAQFVGEGAQGVGELAGEVGGVGDLLEVDEHVPQVLLAHGLDDGQVQSGGAARGGPGLGVGEGGAQFGVGDGGHDELVVGQDAVVNGVGVGIGVQAGAEDPRLIHRRQQGRVVPGRCGGGGALGLRPGGGRFGQAGASHTYGVAVR